MSLLAPIFGLLGVIVGGFLNAAVTAWSERRKTRFVAVAAACLVRDELLVTDDRVNAALELGRWGPVLDPGLPYASGLWAVEHRQGQRSPSVWLDGRKDLVPHLRRDWQVVSRPYRLIDGLSLRFWVDDPNRGLGEAEREAFSELRAALAEAVAILDRFRES
ncbi:hypothetical protein [Actinomadura sp. 9N215]|uniref:hypothetical protein n=1 Tax=Actinomadura sp. 9N215 TaxID=3375150 RepID=UPI00379CD6F4